MRKSGLGNSIFIKTETTRSLELTASHLHFHMAFKVYHHRIVKKKKRKEKKLHGVILYLGSN